ncbi:EKC/KEOPS complex subunit TPRKB-like [Montipora capricornis]|uniref:EKC/KEOPS complex subunit TPRKB-like n=1 Tax=Montipora capricornis TaxID=246305 RepID=UPI0035F1F41F
MVDRPEFLHVNIENNTEYTTNLALFTNVSNSDELRRLVVEGKVEAALLNACMILDPFHAIIAGHKAFHLFQQGKMKTRTLHSEIIFNLSPSSNINDSFKKFGILDDTKEILVVMIGKGNTDEKISELSNLIKGTQVSLDVLETISDQGKIKKVYGISDKELQCDSLENGIISRIATKDAS